MAKLLQPTLTEAEDAPASENKEQARQTRLNFAANPNMQTSYANAFQTSFSKGEVFLTACISQSMSDQEGPFLSIQPQQRIILTPASAKSLAGAMAQVVKQYEEQNGEIKG